MNKARRHLGAAALLAIIGTSCSAPDRPPLPPAQPLSTAELAFNYQDAVEVSGEAAAAAGYERGDVRSLEQVGPNYWKIRFGLADNGDGRVIDIYFDGARREVVSTKEVDVVTDSEPWAPPTP